MGNVHTFRSGAAETLVGRDRELELVRSFLARAVVDGEAMILSGEPGVGKTALLDAAAELAAAQGIKVLRAAGVEFEADIGFAGLTQLLFPLLEDVSTLSDVRPAVLPARLGLDGDWSTDRLATARGVLSLLRGLAEVQPLLVLVDDLHWIDRSSAGVLGFVARRLSGARIGLIIATRIGGGRAYDFGDLAENDLQPLDDDAAEALLGARFPALAARVRRRVLAEAHGNPLALLEFPTAMSGSQREAQQPLPPVLPLSRRLQALYADRVAELPPATRRLLLLAALDGTGDLGVLQTAAGDPDLQDLQPAEQQRLVGVDPSTGRLEFRHPIVRSTIVDSSIDRERRRAHQALAAALPDQPERRALHLAAATVGRDEQVAGLLEHAAHGMLSRGDAVGAVEALLRSADLSPGGADRSRRLAEAAFVGADVTGNLQSVSGLLAAARRADPGGSLQAAVATAYLLLNDEGDVATAHGLLVRAIDAKGGAFDAGDRALLEAMYTLLSVCFFAAGREDLWSPFHAAVARLKPRPPAVLSLCATTFADPARTTPDMLDQLDELISRLPDESDPAQIVWIGRAAFFLDRITACREAHWRVVRDGREGGAVASAIAALIHLCLDDVLTGRWDEAAATAEEGLQLCETHGYRLLEWPLWFGQAVLAAHRGELDEAMALTRRMTRWAAPRRASTVQHYARYVLAVAALGRGDAEEAFGQVSGISRPGALAAHVPLALWSMNDLVESAVRTGRQEDAAAHVAAIEAAGVAAFSPRLAVLARVSAAMADPDPTATGRFEDALAVPGGERWPFDLARVRLVYGERLRRARATPEARVELRAALDTFESLGARPWAARAVHELEACRGARTGPELLTPQEREVAMLAATGLSNKEIGRRLYLSHRTVGAHLYRIFPKLGISSRAALRDALRADGSTPPSP